jgi:hypothetical protein
MNEGDDADSCPPFPTAVSVAGWVMAAHGVVWLLFVVVAFVYNHPVICLTPVWLPAGVWFTAVGWGLTRGTVRDPFAAGVVMLFASGIAAVLLVGTPLLMIYALGYSNTTTGGELALFGATTPVLAAGGSFARGAASRHKRLVRRLGGVPIASPTLLAAGPLGVAILGCGNGVAAGLDDDADLIGGHPTVEHVALEFVVVPRQPHLSGEHEYADPADRNQGNQANLGDAHEPGTSGQDVEHGRNSRAVRIPQSIRRMQRFLEPVSGEGYCIFSPLKGLPGKTTSPVGSAGSVIGS